MMDWKVGFKLTHPFNPDWGVGEVTGVGPLGRSLSVRFSQSGETVTLSTHGAAFERWVFPIGARARIVLGDHAGQEVSLVARTRDTDGYDTYKTSEDLTVHEKDLEPLGRVDGPLERLERLDIDALEHFETRLNGIVLDLERQVQGLTGIIGARVTLFPHQLHIASRVARSHPVRALLADEVGLGKTIEAGMIYSALRQAGRANRVMVLTPDSLTVQWLGELFRKFHDVFALIDDERLQDAAQDHPDQSPWEIYPRTVCSLSFLAENELLALDASELEGGWDLLIVDEAHHLRYDEEGGNAAYRAVESIAEKARNILFLTATPMELDRFEYFGLLRLLQPSLFHDYELFELQLEEIAQANELAASLEAAIGEHPEDDEPEVSRVVTQPRRTSRLPDDLPQRITAAFPEQVRLAQLAERALEGDKTASRELLDGLVHLHPLGDTVFSNTRARVGGFPGRRGEIRLCPMSAARLSIFEDIHRWVSQVAGPDMDPRSAEARGLFDFLRLACGALAGLVTELTRYRKRSKNKTIISFIDDLIARCELSQQEESPRLDALLQEVRQAIARREKLLVFVSHLSDLEFLRDRIEARVGVRVATFHEGLPATDRDIQVALFRSPDGYPVLLSTEAGGEGRNFQFCHRLVHYDLPPSPNRVEQRIGRLDRIGQTRPVESLVLVAENTFEPILASLLDEHIGVFTHTIGGLDPVLEDVADQVVSLALSPSGLDPAAWDALGGDVDEILNGARDVITRGLDHLLHRGGFNRESAQGLIEAIPAELEQQLEEFVIDFCEQTGITVQEKDNNGGYFLALDRYFTLDSLPGVPIGSGYVGTFSREQALEREDFDFFATGHPMVEGIFSFLRDTPYGTATLRRYRKTGLRRCIGIQFNYRIESDARGDVDAPVFFPPRLITLAVDLQGTLRPDLVPLLTARYSKAYPMELEDIQEITRRQGWQEAAAAAAEQEARRLYREAAESAEKAFLEFANDEKRRLEAWFEHRLDTAEARAAFSKSASVVKAAQYEIRSIRREWARRQEELAERQEVFHRGQPILDSVALFVVS